MVRCVALTFDDGPGPSTGPLLDVLARHGARATFFLVGKNIRGYALDGDASTAFALAIRTVRDGHRLGNHTDSHTREPLPPDALIQEIHTVDALLREIYQKAGATSPNKFPFRLPYGPLMRAQGRLDERLDIIAGLGRTHHHWTGIFHDWQPDTDPDQLAHDMIEHVRMQWQLGLVPVLALHDAGTHRRTNGFDRSATVAAVDKLCRELSPERVRYVTVDEIEECERH